MALVVFFSTGISCAQANADNPDQNPPASFRLQSNLVIVRVVVRDPGGHPVTGLKKEDFRLFDEGKEQTLSQFEEEPSPPPPSVTSAPSTLLQNPRFISFYFDDLNSSAAELVQARDAADHYLATSLQPNDRIAIFDAEKVLSDFTSDPGTIHEALMQLRTGSSAARQHPCPDLSDYLALQLLNNDDPQSDAWKAAWEQGKACPGNAFSSSNIGADGPDRSFVVAVRALAQSIADRNQARTRSSLEQIDKVVSLTAPAPGDRSLLLVSPGFLAANEQPSLDRIIDRALRAGITISSLDPKGLAVLMRESDPSRDSGSPSDPRAMQARSSLDRSGELTHADVLVELAQGTGGQFFHNSNDLRAGLKALAADAPHYILAFSPRNAKPDGKFHALKVSLAEKRKGYGIQARRGYYAVADNAPGSELAASVKGSTNVAPQQPQTRLPTPVGNVEKPAPESGLPATSSAPPPLASANNNAVPPGDSPPASGPGTAPVHLRKGIINHITLDRLQQLLAAANGKSDADVAKQLAAMELTERVDLPDLTRLGTAMPGIQARRALLVLADAAAFLKQPAPAAPLPPMPTVDQQVQWLKAAANYAANTLGKLPNFFATRSATVFADSPPHTDRTTMFPYQPLHAIDESTATVLFRDGKETLESGADKTARPERAVMGLVTTGEFGPLLGLLLADASRSSLSWSHWEHGAAGPVGVYRYAVPRNKSHYQAQFCCISGTSGYGSFRQISAYHGELFVDPDSGAVLRITLQADLQSAYPMLRADTMVEYGPVEIGNKTYICPLHSVSIAKAYTGGPSKGLEGLEPNLTSDSNQGDWVTQTMINDVVFDHYHVFRSDSRIVPSPDEP